MGVFSGKMPCVAISAKKSFCALIAAISDADWVISVVEIDFDEDVSVEGFGAIDSLEAHEAKNKQLIISNFIFKKVESRDDYVTIF